jgi:hypothetical protein
MSGKNARPGRPPIGGLALSVVVRPGSAVSEESRVVRDAVDAIVKSAEKSQALFGGKAAAIAQIWALVNESESCCDGDKAEPVDRVAALRAAEVIRALPPGVPLPEAAPEPDGAISLDWIQSRNELFSLTVGPGDGLAYAWLDGSDRGHGVVRFDGQTIPARILQGIDETVRRATAGLGPA